jgi:membrane fusion protein
MVTKEYENAINYQRQQIATLQERLARQESWMRARDELERLKSDALRLQGQLIEAKAAQSANDLQTDNEIDGMRSKIAELDQQVATSETRRSIEIRAPGPGTVTAIASQPGQTVASGARLLTIVPAKSALQAELLAPSTAIGFLRPGQEVKLRYSAFPYQRFGEYAGTVTEVSHAALQPEELKLLVPGQPPSEQSKTFYRVIVTPERQDVKVAGRPEPLQSSMQVDASVLLEKRPLYQLILQPLYDLHGA